MTTEQTKTLMAEIRAKRDKLDACPKHLFEIGPPPYRLGAKFTCSNCAGYMDAVQAFRYCQGFKAAGGNPNEVIPGYE